MKEKCFGELKYLFLWFGSMGLFWLCEMFIPPEICQSVHICLDDIIPFLEGFIFFYVLWYFLIAGSLVYFLFRSPDSFKRFLVYMTVCQLLAIAIFVLFPNKQDLRPEIMPRENAFSNLTGFIHSVDTNTNVCPSLHVAYSAALASVWCKEKISTAKKLLWITLAILIILSTVFVKQHSALDALVAIPVCIVAEIIAYPKKH